MDIDETCSMYTEHEELERAQQLNLQMIHEAQKTIIMLLKAEQLRFAALGDAISDYHDFGGSSHILSMLSTKLSPSAQWLLFGTTEDNLEEQLVTDKSPDEAILTITTAMQADPHLLDAVRSSVKKSLKAVREIVTDQQERTTSMEVRVKQAIYDKAAPFREQFAAKAEEMFKVPSDDPQVG